MLHGRRITRAWNFVGVANAQKKARVDIGSKARGWRVEGRIEDGSGKEVRVGDGGSDVSSGPGPGDE
jgi:hypothetical protein